MSEHGNDYPDEMYQTTQLDPVNRFFNVRDTMKILYRETQGEDRKHPVTGVAKKLFPAVLKTFYDEFVTKKND